MGGLEENMAIFTGAGVAIVTPMKADGAVDYESFRKLIEFQIANEQMQLLCVVRRVRLLP